MGIEEGGLLSVMVGSSPRFIMAWSPNEKEIQVGERMKQESCVPSTFCRLGMICMALDPLPMMPIFLLVKS